MRYERLDSQLKAFSDRLMKEVGLNEQEMGKVATLVAAEVRFLEPGSRDEVHAAGPVPLEDRLEELQAFQARYPSLARLHAAAARILPTTRSEHFATLLPIRTGRMRQTSGVLCIGRERDQIRRRCCLASRCPKAISTSGRRFQEV